MLYHDSITCNLSLFSPPDVQVMLRRIGRKQVQFRIEGFGRSFLLRSDRPDIFAFKENEKQLKQLFADVYQRYAKK